MLRYIAAPALYRPRKGKLSAVTQRYILHASNTLSSILPKNSLIIGLAQTRQTIIITNPTIPDSATS